MSARTATPARSASGDNDRREFWRSVVLSMLRVSVVMIVLGLLYSFAPLGQHLNGNVIAELSLALAILTVVTVWEFWNIGRSRFPEIRAIEAVGVTLPLVLLPFATAYYVMAQEAGASFNAHLSRLDSLYFTITTFSTVGFGDIVAKSEPARAVVMGQMVLDLILIGFIARALLGAARRRRDTLSVDRTRQPDSDDLSPDR